MEKQRIQQDASPSIVLSALSGTSVAVIFLTFLVRRHCPTACCDCGCLKQLNYSFWLALRAQEYLALVPILVTQSLLLIDDYFEFLTSQLYICLFLLENQFVLIWVLAHQDASKWINVVLELLFLTFSSYFSFILIMFITFESINEVIFMYYLILFNICLVGICSFLFNILNSAISCVKNKNKEKTSKNERKDEPTIRVVILHIVLVFVFAVCLIQLLFTINKHEKSIFWMVIDRSVILICVIFILIHRSIHHKPRPELLRRYTLGNGADAPSITIEMQQKIRKTTLQDSLCIVNETEEISKTKTLDQVPWALQIVPSGDEESQNDNDQEKQNESDIDSTESVANLNFLVTPKQAKDKSAFIMVPKQGKADIEKVWNTRMNLITKQTLWRTIRTTFIGETGVSKTAMIRLLKQKTANSSNASKTQDSDDMDDDIDDDIDDDCVFTDLYRRYHFDLRTEFEFWDTVGNERFARYLYECMIASDVITFVYNLSLKNEDKMQKSIEFLQKIMRKIIESLSKEYDFDFEDNKFSCILIGLTTRTDVDGGNQEIKELLERHVKAESKIRQNDKQFEILTSCCLYIPDVQEPLTHEISSIILSRILYANEKHIEKLLKVGWIDSLFGFTLKKHQRPMPIKNKNQGKNKKIKTNILTTINYDDDMINSNHNDGLKLVSSVYRWRMKRNFKFAAQRFVPISICMISFPFLVVFETCFFAIYSAKWGLKTRVFPNLVINHEMLSKYGIIIFDLFSALSIFRRPTLSPETTDNSANGKLGSMLFTPQFSKNNKEEITIDWFLRQTKKQIFGRIMLSFVCVVLAAFTFYNLVHYIGYARNDDNDDDDDVNNIDKIPISDMETFGVLLWYGVIWGMIASWYCPTVDITPKIEEKFDKKQRKSLLMFYRDTTLNSNQNHDNSDNQNSNGLSYSTESQAAARRNENAVERKCADEMKNDQDSKDNQDSKDDSKDNSKEDSKEESKDKGVVATNVDIFLKGYKFYEQRRKQSKEYAKNRRKWICAYLTIGIIYAFTPCIVRVLQNESFFASDGGFNGPSRNSVIRGIVLNIIITFGALLLFDNLLLKYFKQYAKLAESITTIIEIPDKINENVGFEFLSLDCYENLTSWIELRSYTYVKKKRLFAELEFLITFLFIGTVLEAISVVIQLTTNIFGDNNQTSFGLAWSLLISLLCLLRILISGRKFDRIQKRQKRALNHQMLCIMNGLSSGQKLDLKHPCQGPPAWNKLKIGTWDRYYQLQHMAESNLTPQEEKEMKRMRRHLQNFVQLYQEIEKKIVLQSMNPTVFGIGLNGALIKTFVAAIISITGAILKLIFF